MDKRANATRTKGNLFKIEWIQPQYVEYFLNDLALIKDAKTILNLCSGSSLFGTVRIDTDGSLKQPTQYGEIFSYLKQIKTKYDFVYIDPPFKFYNPHCTEIAKHYPTKDHYGDPFEWQYEALRIANKALILRGNLQSVSINWPGYLSKFQEYFLIKDSRPSSTILSVIWSK